MDTRVDTGVDTHSPLGRARMLRLLRAAWAIASTGARSEAVDSVRTALPPAFWQWVARFATSRLSAVQILQFAR